MPSHALPYADMLCSDACQVLNHAITLRDPGPNHALLRPVLCLKHSVMIALACLCTDPALGAMHEVLALPILTRLDQTRPIEHQVFDGTVLCGRRRTATNLIVFSHHIYPH